MTMDFSCLHLLLKAHQDCGVFIVGFDYAAGQQFRFAEQCFI